MRKEGEIQDTWIPIEELDSLNGINQIHLDTRDFKCSVLGRWVNESHRWTYEYGMKTIDEIDKTLIPEEKVKELIHEIRRISRGRADIWKPLDFDGVGEGFWALKYIRFYRSVDEPKKFIVCDRNMNPIEWRKLKKENLK